MTTLYLPNEKVPIKVDDIVIHVQQLELSQKAVILDMLTAAGNSMHVIEAAKLAVKFAVKDVDGIVLSSGKTYKPTFDGKVLTDQSVEELLCLPQSDKIQGACFSLLRGISNPLVDANGKPIPGVEIAVMKKAPSKTKN